LPLIAFYCLLLPLIAGQGRDRINYSPDFQAFEKMRSATVANRFPYAPWPEIDEVLFAFSCQSGYSGGPEKRTHQPS
jgi:hypothetical protein